VVVVAAAAGRWCLMMYNQMKMGNEW